MGGWHLQTLRMRKGNLITVVRAMRANCEVSTSNKMVTVARAK
jgi:hypothetical protein